MLTQTTKTFITRSPEICGLLCCLAQQLNNVIEDHLENNKYSWLFSLVAELKQELDPKSSNS